jgi:hypothetical protein
MKRYSLILFLSIIINLQLSAQKSESFLIGIDFSKVNDLNKIEKLELPVYHVFDNVLITKVNTERIHELKRLNISFDVIDKILTSSDYYIIISPKKKSLQKSIPYMSNVIYVHNESVILKDPISVEELRSQGFTVAQIIEHPISFKNETTLNINNIDAADTAIVNVVSKVNADSVRFFIQSLQNFQTRFLFADTRDAVASWIKSQFTRFGFTDVVIDSFLYQGTWQKNVIATLTGTQMPEKVYVFGGHHDSYSSGNPYNFAPGSDDNASGSAAALEMARVVMTSGYQPESTIKFMTFGAEEYGLWGSRNYADNSRISGMDIKLMINHDMISHTYQELIQSAVDINRYTGSEGWGTLALNVVELYSVLTPFYGSINSGSSDSYPFWQNGYKVVYFEEREFSPYYHSPQDVITNYNMPYCAEVIKSSGALLLTALKIPSEIKNYFAYDMGEGSSVSLTWTPNNENDLAGYKIYLGLSSGNYNQTFITTDTSYIVDSLTEGTKYYIAVSAIDTDGNESFLTERNIIPYTIPLVPTNFVVKSKPQIIDLRWNKNRELDLAGYNIYRSETLDGSYLKINNSTYADTFYLDNSLVSGQYYHYFIKAIDKFLNESVASDTIRSRIISLDKGILLVDETNDGTGALLSPTDEQVDGFYNQLLSNFTKTDYNVLTDGTPALSDLGAYSTVIWQADDNSDFTSAQSAQQTIKEYLDYGGNLIYVGYRPTRAWQKNTSSSIKYSPGMFIHDYFKIDSSLNILNTKFIGAIPSSSVYSAVYIDSSKTLLSDDYHLKGIESIFPASPGISIYQYDTNFDTTIIQGRLKGKPIGVEYLGTKYKSVVLSFPLYYMNYDQAKAMIEDFLIDKFYEITNVNEKQNSSVVTGFELFQNYPNPFNPTTRISWQSPVDGWQTLKVYDILGNEITTLVNEHKPAGRYEVEFDSVVGNRHLASGFYYYQLKVNDFVTSKKMILMK